MLEIMVKWKTRTLLAWSDTLQQAYQMHWAYYMYYTGYKKLSAVLNVLCHISS